MDIKGEIDRNTVIVEDFDPLTIMDRSFRQKINKETVALNNTLDQMAIIDTFRASSQNSRIYTLFKCTCNVS